ncbi:MAG TPA: hypothetical protein VF354_03380 [Candidatus Methanoperedens sp.]
MIKIAGHDDVDIYAPDYSRFSFMKSPYAAHKTNSAVDIYYGYFGGEALSPVDGKVIDIQSFDTPTPFKGRDSKEYLIAIQQGKYVVKIIHIEPDISIGEEISIGERIGTFIKNGYFIFWNDPVMHVEVRDPCNYLRASNNLELLPDIEWKSLPEEKKVEFECVVEDVFENYSLLLAESHTCGIIRGFAIDGGFIDGYISKEDDHFFGILKPGGFFRPHVTLLEITKENSPVRCSGIAFCLSFYEPRIKLIPKKYGDKPLFPGDKIKILLDIY